MSVSRSTQSKPATMAWRRSVCRSASVPVQRPPSAGRRTVATQGHGLSGSRRLKSAALARKSRRSSMNLAPRLTASCISASDHLVPGAADDDANAIHSQVGHGFGSGGRRWGIVSTVSVGPAGRKFGSPAGGRFVPCPPSNGPHTTEESPVMRSPRSSPPCPPARPPGRTAPPFRWGMDETGGSTLRLRQPHQGVRGRTRRLPGRRTRPGVRADERRVEQAARTARHQARRRHQRLRIFPAVPRQRQHPLLRLPPGSHGPQVRRRPAVVGRPAAEEEGRGEA